MEIYEKESMSLHTTFRTGGPARFFVKISSVEDILEILKVSEAERITPVIIGNGSNLLVSDKGIDTTVIQIYDKFADINIDGDRIYAEAGALLSKIAAVARDNCLTGFEFASGIPGTLGGAIVMNAGAYGGEMKDCVESVDILRNGELVTLSADEMKFGYRDSVCIHEKSMIVLGALIKLSEGKLEEINALMNELNQKRRDKQPLEYPSAGSTFKRPEGNFAGKLIMDSGLAGYRVGGAMVSDKHCGFVINYRGASSADIYELIRDVQNIVKEKTGISLETEVRLLGDFE